MRMTSLKHILGGAMPIVPTMPAHMLDWLTHVLRQPGSSQHPRLTTLLPWERTPGRRLFLRSFVEAAILPKAVDEYISRAFITAKSIWYIWNNTVVFLPLVLHQRTRTLFSFQGTTDLFSHRREEVEMTGEHAGTTPNHGLKPVAIHGA